MAILGNHEVNALRFHAIGSDVPIEAPDCVQYPSDAPVTFFGHYALKDASPGPITDNLACLDLRLREGRLSVRLRWDGEQVCTCEMTIVHDVA